MSFVPFQEEKIWGHVTHLFANKHACVSMLQVVQGTYCSVHRHLQRANQFAVQQGEITVSLYGDRDKPNFKYTNSVRLGPGATYTVPSGVWHRFDVEQSGHVVEVYWPDRDGGVCLLSDIDRFCEGGRYE